MEVLVPSVVELPGTVEEERVMGVNVLLAGEGFAVQGSDEPSFGA